MQVALYDAITTIRIPMTSKNVINIDRRFAADVVSGKSGRCCFFGINGGRCKHKTSLVKDVGFVYIIDNGIKTRSLSRHIPEILISSRL